MKLKSLIILLLLIFTLSCPALAETFSDIIVTSPNAIWTDSRAYATLNAAIAAVGANERTIVISSQQTVANLTVPANVNLRFERDGSINNTGQLTINTKRIDAPNRQIFTGTGDIDFAQGTVLKSAWFASFVDAINLTADDEVTLIVSNPAFITANVAVGNNVTLKWESSRNRLTANTGFTLSNINRIEAGKYQLFAGAGTFTFIDGVELDLSWFARLRSAITWIAATNVSLRFSGTHVVDYSDTVPANINLISNSGILSINPGVILTINGPFEAGLYQVFDCVGTGGVVFGDGSIVEAYVEWFGGSGNGVLDNTVAIAKLFESTHI